MKIEDVSKYIPYPKESRAKDVGLKVGDKCVVVEEGHDYFHKGEIITFEYDDGSRCPKFYNEKTDAYIYIERIAPYKPDEIKVGDIVRMLAPHGGSYGNDGIVGFTEEEITGKVVDTHGANLIVDFSLQAGYSIPISDVEKVEAGFTHMYKRGVDSEGNVTVTCGSTTIRKAKRRKDGEEQYVIQYEGSSQNNACVKRSDVEALMAALLEIVENDRL